jgi:hypothetical protein
MSLDTSQLSPEDQAKLASLRIDIQHGMDQLDRGEGIEIDWDTKLVDLHKRYEA